MNALRHVFWAVAIVTTMTSSLEAANQAAPLCSALQKAEKYLVYGDFARCQAELATLRRTCRDVDCQQRAMLLQRVCEAMAIESMLVKEKDGLKSEQPLQARPPISEDDLIQGADLRNATTPYANRRPDLQSSPLQDQAEFPDKRRSMISNPEKWSHERQDNYSQRYEEPPQYSHPAQVPGAWTVPVTPIQFVPVSQAVAPIGQTTQTLQPTSPTQISAQVPSSDSENWGMRIFRWSVVLLAICFIFKEFRPYLAELAISKPSPSGNAQNLSAHTGEVHSPDKEPDIFARIMQQNLDLKRAAKSFDDVDREERLPIQGKLHPNLPTGAIRRVA